MVPVFPLYVVPFPYHSVTVRIFEERYKEMLEHLRGGDGLFVMGRIWRGQEVGGSAMPYRVSTLMRLQSVEPEGDSFRADALGLRRVYLSSFDQESAPFLQAEIEEYADQVLSDDRSEELLTIWKRYLERCLGISEATVRTWEQTPLFNLPLPELTLALTPFLRLPYSNLQFLLELRDPNQRRDNLVKAMIQAIAGKGVDEAEEPWEP